MIGTDIRDIGTDIWDKLTTERMSAKNKPQPAFQRTNTNFGKMNIRVSSKAVIMAKPSGHLRHVGRKRVNKTDALVMFVLSRNSANMWQGWNHTMLPPGTPNHQIRIIIMYLWRHFPICSNTTKWLYIYFLFSKNVWLLKAFSLLFIIYFKMCPMCFRIWDKVTRSLSNSTRIILENHITNMKY